MTIPSRAECDERSAKMFVCPVEVSVTVWFLPGSVVRHPLQPWRAGYAGEPPEDHLKTALAQLQAMILGERRVELALGEMAKRGKEMSPKFRDRGPDNPIGKWLIRKTSKALTTTPAGLWEKTIARPPAGCDIEGAEIVYSASDGTLIYCDRERFRSHVTRARNYLKKRQT